MSQDPPLDRMLRRLVVALGAHGRDEAALTLAAELARKLDAELSGLFVEDSELLDVAALPVTSLLVHHSMQRRAFDALSVERCFRVEEQRLRRLMAAISERHRIPRWSFDVRRGRGGEELARNLGPDDLLVIGPQGREERRRRLAELLARETVHATLILPPARSFFRRHVAVLYEGPQSALSAGRRLAAALEAGLTVIPVSGGVSAQPADEEQLKTLISDFQGPVDVAGPVPGDAASLRAALDLLEPDIVAIGRRGPILARLGTEILDTIIGPRAVLIAAGAGRRRQGSSAR